MLFFSRTTVNRTFTGVFCYVLCSGCNQALKTGLLFGSFLTTQQKPSKIMIFYQYAKGTFRLYRAVHPQQYSLCTSDVF